MTSIHGLGGAGGRIPRVSKHINLLLLRPAITPTTTHLYIAWTRPHTTKSPALAPVPASASSCRTSLLARQRLNRPVAPFLLAHKWHITSVLSISTRLTGLLLSGLFYAFGAAYVVVPYLGLGWDLSSAGMAAAVAGWSVFLKGMAKMSLAFPFAFHIFNGTRMLFFDATVGLKNQVQIRTSGWAVVGLSAMASLALATLL